MGSINRFSQRLLPSCLAEKYINNPISSTFRLTPSRRFRTAGVPIDKPVPSYPNSFFTARVTYSSSSSASPLIANAGWLMGFADKKPVLPEIVQVGDPVLHEPAKEVEPGEIRSDRIQKIIDDMIKVMRQAPGVGLAAPQIGIPLRVSSNFEFFFTNFSFVYL